MNVVFYRIGEHGTDRSSQILLILLFLLFLQILFIKKDNQILTCIILMAILVALSASIKRFIIYIFITLNHL